MEVIKKRFVAIAGALALLISGAATPSLAATNTAEVPPDSVVGFPAEVPLSSDTRIANWQQLQHGLFMHWGVYSMFAGSYKGEAQGIGYPEQIKAWMKISDEEYLAEAAKMTADKWDPVHICSTAKAAGMKYVMITSKHHDGFAMWDTQTTDYNVVKKTAFGKDPLKQLSTACNKVGIKLAFYFSIIDWSLQTPEPYANRNPIDQKLMDLNKAQIKELLTNYGPIAEFWFDMGAPTKAQSKELADLVRSLQPGVTVVNSRVWNRQGDFEVGGDNHVPSDFRMGPWESILSIFPACWSYCDTYKADRSDSQIEVKTRQALDAFIKVMTGDGTFDFNIGPRGDGSIDPFDQKVLDNMGAWHKAHPNAIDGARPTWFPIPKWGRITTKGNTLSLIIPASGWEDGKTITLNGLANTVKSVTIDGTNTPLEHTRQGSDLHVVLKGATPDTYFAVVNVELDGAARMIPTETVELNEGMGFIEGTDIVSRRGAERSSVAADAWVVSKDPKTYQDVTLTFTAKKVQADTDYKVTFGDKSIVVKGAALSAGAVGEGFSLEPNKVQRIRVELAKPTYYADPLGITISQIEVTAAENAGKPIAPKFSLHPKDVAVRAGKTVEFKAQANGRPTPTYQWFRLQDGKANRIPDATGTTYRLVVDQADNGAQFYVEATNDAGTAKSSMATLTVEKPSLNLALDKPSRQSSTAWNGLASRANDGNTDGVWDNGSVSHTGLEDSPWWEVDLGKPYSLGKVNVWNRAATDNCSGKPCKERLKDFLVVASDKSLTDPTPRAAAQNDGTKTIQVAGEAGYPTTVDFEGFEARYVRVSLPGTSKQLSLAEVEVFEKVVTVAPSVQEEIGISGSPAEDIKRITSDRNTVQVVSGSTLELTAKVTAGTPQPDVKWQRMKGDWTDANPEWIDIDGATDATYRLTVGPEHDEMVVRALATNSEGSASTERLMISVVEKPSITNQPKPQTVRSGEKVTFTVGVTGKPAPVIQWMRKTAEGWTNAGNGEALEFEASSDLNGSVYKAVATNSAGSTESQPVTLTVKDPEQPTPVKPTPTEPTPTTPAPTEPAPTTPVPTEPTSTTPIPTPSTPVPSKPAPPAPKPVTPKPTKPTSAKPAPVRPRPAPPKTGN